MDFENNQWDLADGDFKQWLNGDNNGSYPPLSDILKSTYLAFRQKQIERLRRICNQALEYYQEQERIKFQIAQEPWFEDNNINFRYRRLSESEERDETFEENQRIINGILAGDQFIFNEIYEYEFPKVFNLINNNSGSVEIAKDVFQDAIIILIENVHAKKLDLTCSIKTYLYSICKYLWLDQLRQNKRERQMIDMYEEEYITNDISIQFYKTPDVFDNVSSAIKTLGDSCQHLLECYYYKNMSWDEIANELGYSSAASARNQKYKCLERIKSKLNLRNE